MLGAAVEAVAATRGVSGPGSPACYARGRPDGQLRITEPICLTASRTDVLPHTPQRTSVQSTPQYESSAGWTQGLRPRVRGRGPSAPNVYTVYTGHCCCRHHDWFSVPENMTFVTSYPIGSPSHPSKSSSITLPPDTTSQTRTQLVTFVKPHLRL